MIVLPICGQLAASKSQLKRRWTWQATSDLTRPALGTVTICQGNRDLDSYAVTIESLGTMGFHEVLFEKLDAKSCVYAVTVSPSGNPIRCTCSGHRRHGHCKHRDTTADLIAEDILPLAPSVAAPVQRGSDFLCDGTLATVRGFGRAEASF